jgi:hypothetical protein
MLHYFLTGDEASRQTVIDLAQFVMDIDDGRKTIFRFLIRATPGARHSRTGITARGAVRPIP